MTDHHSRLNAWHLDLAITADAINHTLAEIEEPEGLSATAYVLKNHLIELVESCPFPEMTMLATPPDQALDYDDLSDNFTDDFTGVPVELLSRTGGRDD